MDQFSQTTSNNDLQKAIDEISNGGEAAPAPADDTNAPVNLGEPPVPPASDFGMPPMDGAEVTPPEQPAPEAAPAPAPAGDLAAVRETALKELVPIIDKAGLSPDRQFGIIVAVIESTGDKSFISKAFEAARTIPDDKTRAEALLRVVSLIDK